MMARDVDVSLGVLDAFFDLIVSNSRILTLGRNLSRGKSDTEITRQWRKNIIYSYLIEMCL